MKHKWQTTAGGCGHMTLQCKKCGALDHIGADPLDVDFVIKENKRIRSRKDCKGHK